MDRVWVADELEERTEAVAEIVTNRLFEEHPDWEEQWGAEARRRTEEDVAFTTTFLAAAIRADDAEIFADYVRWLRTLLVPRGVDEAVIRGTHEILADEVASLVHPEAGREVREIIEASHDVLDEPLDQEPSEDLDARGETLVDALLDGEGDAAGEVLDRALDDGMQPDAFAEELLAPAMREVGRRWQVAEISVADEHLATATARKLLADLYTRREFAGQGRGSALLACVEGCRHDLGLQIVADAFEDDGWEVANLGADVPVDDLVQAVRDRDPDVVCLSMSMPDQISPAREAIEGLREGGPPPTWILVGGRVLNEFNLHQVLGADAWAPNSFEALKAVRQR